MTARVLALAMLAMIFSGCLGERETGDNSNVNQAPTLLGHETPERLAMHDCYGYEMFVTSPKEIFPFEPPNATWRNVSPLIVPDYMLWTANCDTIVVADAVFTEAQIHIEMHDNMTVPPGAFEPPMRYFGVFEPMRIVVEDPALMSALAGLNLTSTLGQIDIDLGPVPWVRVQTNDSEIHGWMGHFIYHNDPLYRDNVFRIMTDYEDTAWWSVHRTLDDHYQVFSSFMTATGNSPVTQVPGQLPTGEWFAPGAGMVNMDATFTFKGSGVE